MSFSVRQAGSQGNDHADEVPGVELWLASTHFRYPQASPHHSVSLIKDYIRERARQSGIVMHNSSNSICFIAIICPIVCDLTKK